MRRLIIRDHRGHATLDLDTEEAIRELEQGMNNGMLAFATTGKTSTQIDSPRSPEVGTADEVRLMWPMAGG